MDINLVFKINVGIVSFVVLAILVLIGIVLIGSIFTNKNDDMQTKLFNGTIGFGSVFFVLSVCFMQIPVICNTFAILTTLSLILAAVIISINSVISKIFASG